jgi:histidine ammonia-lyase
MHTAGPVPPTIVTAAADLGADLIRAVAAGQSISIAPELAAAVDARCAAARAVLAAGAPVYGVTTGMGALSGVRLTPAEQAAHQRNLMLARATGGPPWLPPADVRALLAVRLRTLLSGDAGVSAALCQRLADVLANGPLPAVPADAAGTAGEIVALAHAFGPLAGIGEVLVPAPGNDADPRNDADHGNDAGPGNDTGPQPGPYPTEPAAAALARLHRPEFPFGPKEGIALLAGVPGATALVLQAGAEAATVAAMLESAAALSIAAVGAPADPYDPLCARGDDVLGAVLARLRARLGPPGRPARMLQAPVSFRVAGPVLAHLARAATALAEAADRALTGVTDSPAFAGDRFIGTAGFHGIDLAGHADQLTAAVAHAADVSAARTHRLLDPRVTGLAAQLAPRPGPDTGLVTVHKRAAGEVHAIRRLAGAAAVGTIETSGGQEDVQAFAWAAAMNARAALRRARRVAACEALTAFQAGALAGGPWPAGIDQLTGALAALVEPITADRPFGPDIERLAAGSWAVTVTLPPFPNPVLNA